MRISFILRPFSKAEELTRFIERLSDAEFDEVQIIIPPCIESDILPEGVVMTGGEDESGYLISAAEEAALDYITTASVNDRYISTRTEDTAQYDLSDIDNADEPEREEEVISREYKDIIVFGAQGREDLAELSYDEDIADVLSADAQPLSRCAVRAELFRRQVFSGDVTNNTYERLIAQLLLNGAQDIEISEHTAYCGEIAPAGEWRAAAVLLYADKAAELLKASRDDVFRRIAYYMIFPLCAYALSGKADRKCYELLCLASERLCAYPMLKKQLELLIGFDIGDILGEGYRCFEMFCKAYSKAAYKDVKDGLKELKKQTKALTTALSGIKTTLNSVIERQKSFDEQQKKLSRAARDIKKSTAACLQIFNASDRNLFNDNLFYLSETVADIYTLCSESKSNTKEK